MDDIDKIIALLRDEPLPAGLSAIDATVFTGMAAGTERQAARRGLVLACAVAGLIGLWGGIAMPGAAPAHEDPLLGLPEAAPSHLLAL